MMYRNWYQWLRSTPSDIPWSSDCQVMIIDFGEACFRESLPGWSRRKRKLHTSLIVRSLDTILGHPVNKRCRDLDHGGMAIFDNHGTRRNLFEGILNETRILSFLHAISTLGPFTLQDILQA